jgi:hypothetical protein
LNNHLYYICFGVKYFLKNVFGILKCLVGVKIIVNGNHFQFDRKSFFNFCKRIYDFENLKSFSRFTVARMQLLPESGLLESGRPDSGKIGRMTAGRRWILFYAVGDFFVRAKR